MTERARILLVDDRQENLLALEAILSSLNQVLVRASSNKPEIVVVVESTRSEEDMRALFREEVKPRLARRPQVGAYNQEI